MFSFLFFLVAAGLLFVAIRVTCGPCVMGHREAELQESGAHPRIPVLSLGWALSLFLVVTYILCVSFDLIFPGFAMYEAWINLMPGVTWLSWSSFLIGLIWAFIYGWYAALLFGGLFNAFAARA